MDAEAVATRAQLVARDSAVLVLFLANLPRLSGALPVVDVDDAHTVPCVVLLRQALPCQAVSRPGPPRYRFDFTASSIFASGSRFCASSTAPVNRCTMRGRVNWPIAPKMLRCVLCATWSAFGSAS